MTYPTHFSLEEFLTSDTADNIGANNYPSWYAADNLRRLADLMEKIRAGLGNKSITILSGYRSQEVNKAVGGADNSAHLYGLGCDFVSPDYGTPLDICHAIEPHMKMLGIDQLIWEFSDWVHLGLTDGEPRCECLTINNTGTHYGFPAY